MLDSFRGSGTHLIIPFGQWLLRASFVYSHVRPRSSLRMVFVCAFFVTSFIIISRRSESSNGWRKKNTHTDQLKQKKKTEHTISFNRLLFTSHHLVRRVGAGVAALTLWLVTSVNRDQLICSLLLAVAFILYFIFLHTLTHLHTHSAVCAPWLSPRFPRSFVLSTRDSCGTAHAALYSVTLSRDCFAWGY